MAVDPRFIKQVRPSAFKVSRAAPAVAAKASAAAVQSAALRRPAPQQHAAVVRSQPAQGYQKRLPPQPFKVHSPAVSLKQRKASSATILQSIQAGGVAKMAPAVHAVAAGGLSSAAVGLSAMPPMAPMVVAKKPGLVPQPTGFGWVRDVVERFDVARALPPLPPGVHSGITRGAALTMTSEVVSFASMGLSSGCKEGSDCCDTCSGHEGPSPMMWPVHTLPQQETTLSVEDRRAALQRSQRTLAKLHTGVRSRPAASGARAYETIGLVDRPLDSSQVQLRPYEGPYTVNIARQPLLSGRRQTRDISVVSISSETSEERDARLTRLIYQSLAGLSPAEQQALRDLAALNLSAEELRELRRVVLRHYPVFAPGTIPGRGMRIATVLLNTKTLAPA